VKVIATAVIALAALSACGNSPPPTQEIQFGPLTFDVTADWQRKDTSKPGWASSMFTPSDNSRFESVTVIRSHRSDSKNTSLEQLLVTAQRSLRDVKLGNLRPVKTASGLVGGCGGFFNPCPGPGDDWDWDHGCGSKHDPHHPCNRAPLNCTDCLNDCEGADSVNTTVCDPFDTGCVPRTNTHAGEAYLDCIDTCIGSQICR
jgi:hypothetical protein